MSIILHLTVNTYNPTVVVFVATGTISTAYGLVVIGSTVGQPRMERRCIRAQNYHPLGRGGRGGARCAGAVHMAMFLVRRFVAGLGAGILACIVPIYQAEVSTAENEGGDGLRHGRDGAHWFMTATNPAAELAWRFPLAFQVLFPLCVLVGAPFIPESPRWLLAKGKGGEALSVLQKLHSTNGNNDSTQARGEFTLSLFSTPADRKRSLIATILMIGNQFLGTFVPTNYGVLIYASLGLTGSMSSLLNVCWTSFTLLGNTWIALYIDRFGRRRFLLAGATGCTLCMVFLCALTASFLNTDNTPGLRATVFFIFFYIFGWCFFVGAMQFAYIAEIFPNYLREVTLVAAPVKLDRVGWRFYLVLIVPSVLYIKCIYFLFPVTKGRTLEGMRMVFGEEPVYSP
ncbi:general substrate transporter [Aspergillus fruticulosus]